MIILDPKQTLLMILSLIQISESKDSSAIENIITTYDEIFKELVTKNSSNGNSKESIPAIDSVIIPPTPGMGAPRTSAPPTVIVPTGGSLPSTAPLGIPSAPQATPYR